MCIQFENVNDFITLMIKPVGTKCNMSCKYCYENIKKDNNTYEATAEDIKRYLETFRDYKNILILFHGGEPLLSDYDVIKSSLEYIRNNFKNNYKIQFQTNGTLLNDSWIELFKKYEPKISISISLDPIEKKDLRMAKSFNYRDVVDKNIKKYINEIDNIGIISVVHKFNIEYFEEYINHLMSIGIRSLTINKYQSSGIENDFYITEKEYVHFLIKLSLKWIKEGWYKSINIQPLNALFSSKKNRICSYLADEKKCMYFNVLCGRKKEHYCDHITNINQIKLMNKCKTCEIYEFCGGGCFAEQKDDTFCEARKELFNFLKEIKEYENSKFMCK